MVTVMRDGALIECIPIQHWSHAVEPQCVTQGDILGFSNLSHLWRSSWCAQTDVSRSQETCFPRGRFPQLNCLQLLIALRLSDPSQQRFSLLGQMLAGRFTIHPEITAFIIAYLEEHTDTYKFNGLPPHIMSPCRKFTKLLMVYLTMWGLLNHLSGGHSQTPWLVEDVEGVETSQVDMFPPHMHLNCLLFQEVLIKVPKMYEYAPYIWKHYILFTWSLFVFLPLFLLSKYYM